MCVLVQKYIVDPSSTDKRLVVARTFSTFLSLRGACSGRTTHALLMRVPSERGEESQYGLGLLLFILLHFPPQSAKGKWSSREEDLAAAGGIDF